MGTVTPGTPTPRHFLPWLAGIAACLWVLYILLSQDAVLGEGRVNRVLNQAAVAVTVMCVVAGLAELVLNRALRGAESEPTAFMRLVVYAVLAFAATFLTLRYFGLQLSEVFATSAIVTAAVGFAMQPTLGSMISGLALHLDHAIRVGDGFMHDGQWVEVTSLGWRSMIGRTMSGRIVVVPNARVADQIIQVAPGGRPTQAQFHFLAGVGVRPDVLSELVTEMMIDLPLVEEALPILVAPVGYQPYSRALRYGVKYWIRSYAKAEDVSAEANRRLWYVFQRNGLPYPTSNLAGAGEFRPEGLADAERDALVQRAVGMGQSDLAARLSAASDVLLYATGEYLIVPPRTEGSAFLVLHGEAEASVAFQSLQQANNEAQIYHLGHGAAVRHIAIELAHYIGPYAEFAVGQAARGAVSLSELCYTVAEEIADAEKRAQFLAAVYPEAPARIIRGAWLEARRNAAGSLVCGAGLRARRETVLLAVPRHIVPGLTKQDSAAREG